jgi:hypothetical protein
MAAREIPISRGNHAPVNSLVAVEITKAKSTNRKKMIVG